MFRIGQKVVCIKNKMDNGAPRHPRVDYPEVGGVYTVAAAWTGKDGKALLQFDELRSPKKYRKWGFRASYFRTVVERKTDISIFTAMLKTQKNLSHAFSELEAIQLSKPTA
jgi:hypothetical protein